MPIRSPPSKAPNTAALSSRAANQLNGSALSASNVLPNASGTLLSASSRIPR